MLFCKRVAFPLVVILSCFLGHAANQSDSTKRVFSNEVMSYLKNYCINCHGAEKQKADRRFDKFIYELDGQVVYDPNDHSAAETLIEILDVINLGEMPPDKKKVKQPSLKETRDVIAWLSEEQAFLNEMGKTPETVMRKLNAFEYRNTMRDLLKLGEVNYFNVAKYFSDDEREHGFANIGEALNLSEEELVQYIEAADDYLDGTLFWKSTQPKSRILNMDFASHPTSRRVKQYNESFVSYSVYQRKVGALDIAHGGKLSVMHHLFRPQTKEPVKLGKYSPIGDRYQLITVPADGYYTIRLKADAVNRITHPYEGLYSAMEKQKIKLGLYATSDHREGHHNHQVKKRYRIALFELEDNEVKTYTTKAWLYKGAILCIRWENFLIDERNSSVGGTFQKLYKGVHKKAIDNIDAYRASLGLKPYRHSVEHIKDPKAQRDLLELELFSDVFEGPRMRIYNLELSGPENPVWPPESHKALFGNEIDPNKVDIHKMLNGFLPKAFRRPVRYSEIQLYYDWIINRQKEGVSRQAAIRDGLIFILSSPSFLYLQEREGRLDSYALASRLSYFLWSSMPDDELFALAETGELLKPDVLRSQVFRMLSDPKSDGHIKNFTESWLHLYKLGSMPPDGVDYRDYYIWDIETNMRRESLAFYEHVLRSNGPLQDFLDSNYLIINEVMADYYGIKGVSGDHFRKVSIDRTMVKRGGVLNQASILTVSANGVETSPVLRGMWVLENLLGTPPAPPPPDVEVPEPDTRGAITVRDQLKKHRSNESCADCHAKIDPLGFPFESYGPTGKLRPHYYKMVDRVNSNGFKYDVVRKKRANIDTSGILSTGERFENMQGFKKIMLEKKHLFYRALTEKMMTYATGRHMSYKDKIEIDAITQKLMKSKPYPNLTQLITEVVLSETFSNK